MIRNASADDLPLLRELLRDANDMPYPLAPVAAEKCFEAGFEGATTVRLAGDLAASVTCGKYLRILAVRRDARGRGVGSALLEDARSRGARVIAAEPGNYFTPGVLESQAAFFEKRGYERTAETWNLEVDLSGGQALLPVPQETGEAGVPVLHASSNLDRVLDFIQRNFGGIWRFEASRAPENLLYTADGGEITGFVVHDANNRGLGFFGPTGVAKQHRGRGIGRALLLASLAELRARGYERAVIPWTDALDFYRKSCGAKPRHRFIAFTKRQP